MRVNGVMGVIAVGCVVAVVNGATLGANGRLHHRVHRTAPNIRRFTAMEFVDAQAESPPPAPELKILSPRLIRSGFIALPGALPDSPEEEIDLPEPVLQPVFALAPMFLGQIAPPREAPPQPPLPPPLDPPRYSFISQQPAAIPEPTTWAIAVLGFGVVGAVLRRRRRGAAAAWRVGHGRAR